MSKNISFDDWLANASPHEIIEYLNEIEANYYLSLGEFQEI